MSERKFILPSPETITLSGQTIDKLLRAGDGDAALLYLYVLKTRGQGTPEGAVRELGRSTCEVEAAMAVLGKLGLIHFSEEVPDTPHTTHTMEKPEEQSSPKYTINEIRQELKKGSTFSFLVEEAQRKLGKILSPDDLLRLFGIYDNLRLPPEVIMHLITHCMSESLSNSGGGRNATMKFIEKAAYTWEREGILSIDRAEEYIKRAEQKKGLRGEIKSALQIKDRELSSTERQYVDSWVDMGFEAEAIEIAYDKTIIKTGKLVWGYMDSILKSWHGKNMHKADVIREKDGRPQTNQPRLQLDNNKYGAPNQKDIERIKQLIASINGE